ncbi:NADH-quinone oxidoreductase subunit C [Slackia heliotrinireducens]|uniref:NADH:ubiquinone oxidoreductase 30kDa subunit domain-containing protein n=1 Tax=Slackia heliotrinireducens (strain ATCC 29202 / DSM 20476 / NCTC 11029 / RHS 1) TaxID=471855 RepID=C7N625_SLAHD|nr:NADH-quinone oxidoreductase subunit C [Slackia heliotrinireducens]ACV22360.1 hypothetical protein Shel_13370 [Slackia heliotrinireducens DSM 20476]VEH00633.1 Respiratory-chain NADH dehydrogenase, 30 Kd subunit [Slackia heliotrinireducens]
MALQTTFETIAIDELLDVAAQKKADGYRFVQVLCHFVDPGIDVVYSFMSREGVLENYTIKDYDRETQTIPSITGKYLAAFPFENEAHDLYGVKITDIAIDFAGKFYDVAMDTPMTVITPEQKAARDKRRAAAAAKAAKEAAPAEKPKQPAAEAKPEAKPAPAPAKAQPAKDVELEAKIAAMPPEKAAKFRAAMEAKAARDAAQKGGE